MKRFFPGSLVFIFLINMIGSVGIISYHRYHMNHYIKSLIRNENYSGVLLTLRFSQDDIKELQWFEEGHEFKHEGHMYDIVRSEYCKDGSVVYHCIKDEKESDLYKEIEKDLSKSGTAQKGKNTVVRLFNFLSTLFFDTQAEVEKDNYVSSKHTLIYISHYVSNCLETPSDPPDTV